MMTHSHLWAALALIAGLGLPVAAEPPLQVPRLRALDFAPSRAAIAALSPARRAEIHALVSGPDLGAVHKALREGRLTSEDLTTFFLARIAAHDADLRAFIEVNPNALAEARAADAALHSGQEIGPLQGIPVALKDNIETAPPLHTTANAAVLLDNQAKDDAEIVRRLRAAGAVILGKTSLSEFAGAVSTGSPMGGAGAVSGQAMNPLGPFPTYGSSSGSAIAVAALLAPLAVGTETSGSLIAPATLQGVVALKPTKGRVPTTGIIPLISHNDTAGAMARSVADVAMLEAVLDGQAPAMPLGPAALNGVRVGVLGKDIGGDKIFAEAAPRATEALVALGAVPVPAQLADPSGKVALLGVLIGTGIRFEVMPYVAARHPDLRTPEDLIAWNGADPARRAPFGQDFLIALGGGTAGATASDHAELAAEIEAAARGALERAFTETGAEVLLSTSSLHAPFYATAGYPAVTVPLGLTRTGWPMGATLIGKPGSDAPLLALAAALEAGTAARVTPPVARQAD